MEITGRVTADATLHTLADERQVTNFTLVINERFTTKAGEKREVATFFKCAYWVSPKLADHLKKGCIVSLYGRIGIDVYKNGAGEPRGSLTFHVNHIQFIAAPTTKESKPEHTATATPETIDDLPF